MRIRDANVLRKALKANLENASKIGRVIAEEFIDILDDIPETEVVSLEEYEALQERCRQLEKRLSDVGSSPFDGGMSQAEYFNGETDCKRRERWVLVCSNRVRGGFRHRWKCTGCGAGIVTEELRPPSEHRCYICGACMDWGASDD